MSQGFRFSAAAPRPLQAPGVVPDADTLRQALLRASWQRDRWIARRRIALRWVLWCMGKFGLPVLLVLSVGAFVWPRVWPTVTMPDKPAVPASITVTPPATVVQAVQRNEPDTALPASSLSLRMELEWKAVSTKQVPLQDDQFPVPQLKTDNALQSQEH